MRLKVPKFHHSRPGSISPQVVDRKLAERPQASRSTGCHWGPFDAPQWEIFAWLRQVYNLGNIKLVELTHQPIDTNRLLTFVTHPECGAEVLFVGTTRQWTGNVETTFLEYDGYSEMALKVLKDLENNARTRWNLREVAIVHRLGRVDIGQASVAVAVGSAHRAEAFEAARWLIDQLKEHVPIWKCEHGQGPAQWVHPS